MYSDVGVRSGCTKSISRKADVAWEKSSKRQSPSSEQRRDENSFFTKRAVTLKHYVSKERIIKLRCVSYNLSVISCFASNIPETMNFCLCFLM